MMTMKTVKTMKIMKFFNYDDVLHPFPNPSNLDISVRYVILTYLFKCLFIYNRLQKYRQRKCAIEYRQMRHMYDILNKIFRFVNTQIF